MSFCSYSKECEINSATVIDNKFLKAYLPEATGNAVKVYLYGLFLCQTQDDDITLDKFAQNISIEKDEVIDCFKFWEEFGLINIISDDPFLIKFLPVTDVKPKKINAEKYSEFNRALQVLIPDRMITTNEYSSYFSIMENYSIKPEAMLMIVKYCADLKGNDIGYRYILKVANDFADRGITTVAKIEKELEDYSLHSSELTAILALVSPNRKPDMEDLNFLNKWKKDFSFDGETILFTAKTAKIKSMQKLDKELSSLFANKKFSVSEIDAYYKNKAKITELAYKIDRELSVYIEVIEPVVENYVLPWLNKGYDDETLLFIANYCFKKNRRSLEDMNETVEKLYKNGLITITAIAEYVKGITACDEFIKQIINCTGLTRKPTDWDRENLKTWRSWNFSDEMILEASKLAQGKSNPLSYINAILSGWKAQGIYAINQITSTAPQSTDKKASKIHTRTYTKEELDALIDNIEDVEF